MNRLPLIHLASGSDRNSAISWTVLRLVLAGLLAAHGWARWMAGAVEPFAQWLGTQGVPLGHLIASGITALEIIGTVLLAYGLLVRPQCLLFAAIYAVGIVLVHWPAGWFVVGLGRNGAEYSVLLIVCLLLVGWQHRGWWRP